MMSTTAPRVCIADDHWTVIQGLQDFLEHHGIVVTGTAYTAEQLIEHCRQHPDPDEIVILDLSLDDEGGEQTFAQIKEVRPEGRVLVLSMRESLATIRRMYEIGVDGYITKTAGPDETVKAVQTIAGGDTYYMAGVAERILEAQRRRRDANPRDVLTAHELAIFRRLAAGESNEEIGTALGISAKSVANRSHEIRRKLGGVATTELGWVARKYGVLELDL